MNMRGISRGKRFLILSLILCAGLIFAVAQVGNDSASPFAGPAVPIFGCLAGAAAFFIGQLSYPRVQNLKVTLSGSLTGLLSIVYFLLVTWGQTVLPFALAPDENFVLLLYSLSVLNLLLFCVLPSFVKYRTSRFVTVFIFAIELLVLIIVRLYPYPFPEILLSRWGQTLNLLSFAPAVLAVVVMLLSMISSRNDPFLSGIFAGSALLLGFAAVYRVFLFPRYQIDRLVFAALPLYLDTGLLFHWIVRMEHRALYDPLLQIYNRSYCSQIIEEQSSLSTRPPFTVAMIDIDHFKKVNDTWGHQCGDRVLFHVAQTVQKTVIPAGVVCRYGGEELAVFFPRKELDAVLPLVEDVRAVLEKTAISWKSKTIQLTVSCGVSCREKSSQPVEEVIAAADRALYTAKEKGRNQVRSQKVRSTVPAKKA